MSTLYDNHAEMVESLVKPGYSVLMDLTPIDCHNIHMLMGMSGEMGELMDAIKKSIMYQKPLDLAHVIEEMGDIEFYFEGLRQGLGISRSEVLEQNVSKLSKRYESGSFTNEQAQERADKQQG